MTFPHGFILYVRSFLTKVAEEGVALAADGAAAKLTRTAARPLGLDLSVNDSTSVGVELTFSAPLGPPAASRTILFQDKTRDGKSHVLVEVRAHEPLTLGSPSQGELSPDARVLADAMASAEVPLELRLRGPGGGAWDGLLRWLGVR